MLRMEVELAEELGEAVAALVDGELVAVGRGDALAAEVGRVGEGLGAGGRGLLGEGGERQREAER
jgi:hypothetical protein